MPKVSETYKEERRTHLVSAAERVFLGQGYVRTTVQDILTEAGVSRGGLYLYFGNKAEIFEAVLERQDQHVLEQLRRVRQSPEPIGPALLELANPGPVEPEARRRVAMVVEYSLEHRDDPERRAKLTDRLDRAEAALVDLLQEGVHRGEFHPRLPLRTIALFLIQAQDGWSIHMAVWGESNRTGADYSAAMSVFMRHSLGMVDATREDEKSGKLTDEWRT